MKQIPPPPTLPRQQSQTAGGVNPVFISGTVPTVMTGKNVIVTRPTMARRQGVVASQLSSSSSVSPVMAATQTSDATGGLSMMSSQSGQPKGGFIRAQPGNIPLSDSDDVDEDEEEDVDDADAGQSDGGNGTRPPWALV